MSLKERANSARQQKIVKVAKERMKTAFSVKAKVDNKPRGLFFLSELSGGSCFEGSGYWGPQDGVVSNGGTCPNVGDAFTISSSQKFQRFVTNLSQGSNFKFVFLRKICPRKGNFHDNSSFIFLKKNGNCSAESDKTIASI